MDKRNGYGLTIPEEQRVRNILQCAILACRPQIEATGSATSIPFDLSPSEWVALEQGPHIHLFDPDKYVVAQAYNHLRTLSEKFVTMSRRTMIESEALGYDVLVRGSFARAKYRVSARNVKLNLLFQSEFEVSGSYHARLKSAVEEQLRKAGGVTEWDAPVFTEDFDIALSRNGIILRGDDENRTANPVSFLLKMILKELQDTVCVSGTPELKPLVGTSFSQYYINEFNGNVNSINSVIMPPSEKDSASSVSKESLAIAILYENPELTNKEIAKRVGCTEEYLSRSEKFKSVRRTLKNSRQQRAPGDRRAGVNDVPDMRRQQNEVDEGDED